MMTRTPSGILLPREWERSKPCSGRRRGRWSPTMGLGAVVDADGSIAWQEDEWQVNALHDAGEQDMLSVYLTAAANPTKYLAMLNDASLAETDGTMAAVTETKTPASGGYDRQQITNDISGTGWTNDGLQGGDYRFSAAEKTFGPMTTASATITSSALTTTLTSTAGLVLLTLALSATTVIAVTQSFKYILRWTEQ